ncbi:MAG TPA: GntR family transcriptional regulator [Terriglobales bacterium]|nr:GntR family transcriptional regulator [Terriglobales bacterium]
MLPDLDRVGPTPIYQQIKDWMQAQIASGNWPEHFQLKSEIDLATELNVNRGTLRNAIKALMDEGLLVRIHGKGTFVAANVLEQPLAESLTTFSESLINQNIPFETRVLEQMVISPDLHVVSLLSIDPETPAFFLKRIRLVKNVPAIFVKNYVVYPHCVGIETCDFVNRRLFEVLETDFKLTLAWGRRYFEARIAGEEVASSLALQVGDPVMYAKQIVYLEDNSPIEMSDIWIPGNHFRLSAVVKRGKSLSVMSGLPEYMQSELKL